MIIVLCLRITEKNEDKNDLILTYPYTLLYPQQK